MVVILKFAVAPVLMSSDIFNVFNHGAPWFNVPKLLEHLGKKENVASPSIYCTVSYIYIELAWLD